MAAQSEFDRTLADIAAPRNEYDSALSTLERLTGTSPDFDSFALSELPGDGFAAPPPLKTLEASVANNADVLLAQAQQHVARADLYFQLIQYVEAFRQLLLDRLSLRAATGELGTDDMVAVMRQVGAIVGPPGGGGEEGGGSAAVPVTLTLYSSSCSACLLWRGERSGCPLRL